MELDGGAKRDARQVDLIARSYVLEYKFCAIDAHRGPIWTGARNFGMFTSMFTVSDLEAWRLEGRIIISGGSSGFNFRLTPEALPVLA